MKTMTKKKLRMKLENLEMRHEHIIAEKVHLEIVNDNINKQLVATRKENRETIRKINADLSCTKCTYIDENGKKLRPQKCATCRRGAKDNYTEQPVTEANVISNDFLKSTEAMTCEN